MPISAPLHLLDGVANQFVKLLRLRGELLLALPLRRGARLDFARFSNHHASMLARRARTGGIRAKRTPAQRVNYSARYPNPPHNVTRLGL